jgi:hypothetical protein
MFETWWKFCADEEKKQGMEKESEDEEIVY